MCVKGFREFAESNASAPAVQLHSIRMCLAVIAYRMWNFGVMDVSRAFLRSGPLERESYVQLPLGAEKGNFAWEILKPLYGLSTACEYWYKTIRNFLANEFGGNVTSLDKSAFGRNKTLATDMD